MANKLIIDGEVCLGSTDLTSASSLICKDKNGDDSNVQNEIDELRLDVAESNSNVEYMIGNMVQYNPTTDELNVYSNGELVGTIYCAFKEPKALVPILSGYTCDIGEVIYENYWDTSYPWNVFRGNTWHGAAGIPNSIGFKFYEPTCVKRVKFKAYPDYGANIKIQASKSESDSSWFDLTDSIFIFAP